MAGVRTGGGMITSVGTWIILRTADPTATAASGMITAVRTILPKFAAGVALRVLASVGTGIVLGATDPTAGLTRGMITAIRAIGFLLEALAAHRLLCAQAQRQQEQEAKAQ